MRKILNISATIRELSIGDCLVVPFKDMTEHCVRNQAYRNSKGEKKFKVTVERLKLRTLVTRIS